MTLGVLGATLPGWTPGVRRLEERVVRAHMVAQRHRGWRAHGSVPCPIRFPRGGARVPIPPTWTAAGAAGDSSATGRRHAAPSRNPQVAGPSCVPPAHGCPQRPALDQHDEGPQTKGLAFAGVPRAVATRGPYLQALEGNPHAQEATTALSTRYPTTLQRTQPKGASGGACTASAPNTLSGSCSSKPTQTEGFTPPLENGVPSPAPWRDVHRL